MRGRKGNIVFWGGLICLCYLTCSCQKKKKESNTGYYNIDSLITAQIHDLSSRKVSLSKTAFLNGKTDSIYKTSMDTILWSKELDIFKQLDAINKPISSHSYTVQNLPDSKSNLIARSIITNRKLPVEYLKIYYDGSINNLKKIEALYHEENLLYGSSQKLLMEFENIYNKITLINYSIHGKQKVLLGDSVNFFLNGRVIVN